MPTELKSETPLAAKKPSTTLSSTSPEVTLPELAWALELPPVLTTLLRRTMAPSPTAMMPVLQQHVVLDQMPVLHVRAVDIDAVMKSQDRAMAHADVGTVIGEDANAAGVDSGWDIADFEAVAVDRDI